MKKHFILLLNVLLIIVIFGGFIVFNYFSGTRMKEIPYHGMTKEVKKDSFDEFAAEIADMIQKYDGKIVDEKAFSIPFYSRRLIVQGKGEELDLTSYGAKIVVQGPDDMYVMQFTTRETAEKACEQLQGREEIVYCEPDKYVKATENTEEYDAMSWGVNQIGADVYAKHVKSITAESIVVAVIDSGVYKHSFLADRVIENGMDFVDNDMRPNDQNSHGTHVAGTIVDCTPGLNVKILPVRVLGANGSGSMLATSLGVRYAVQEGAQIINMSLSGEKNYTLDNAVIYAVNRGCTVVVSAGNENESTENTSPAHLDECIVVAAINRDWERAEFSSWGASIDFSAPGVNIVSCVPKLFWGYTIGEDTKGMNGTSMAAPHISALAAMIKLENQSFTTDEIQYVMEEKCIDLGRQGWDPYFGWGVPAFSEVIKIEEPEPETTDIAEPISEETTSVDLMDAYAEILSEYKMLAGNRFNYNLREQTKYANEGVWNFGTGNPYCVYYRLEDLAEDGQPELLISINEKNEPKNIVDIFGIKNGKPLAVIESHASVGYRSRYYITMDNRIKNVSSGGALNTQVNYWKLYPNSVFMELDEQYIYDGWDGVKCVRVDANGTSEDISEETYQSISSASDVDDVSEWTLLYEPDSESNNRTENLGNENSDNKIDSVPAYQGIFMNGDIFISSTLYSSSETGAIGVIYRVTEPKKNEAGYVEANIEETIGEIYELGIGDRYEITGGEHLYDLIYSEGEVTLMGDSNYEGTYIQVSNSGANMVPSDIWLNIPGQEDVSSGRPEDNIPDENGIDYILPNSNTSEVTEEQLMGMSTEELRLARNEIFARHGRRFNSAELQQYFNTKAWYEPRYTPEEFERIQYDILNEVEWKNIERILAMEKK